MTDPERSLPVVHAPADLPAFASEAEEAEFWSAHSPGEGFFAGQDEGDFPLPPTREVPSSTRETVTAWETVHARVRRPRNEADYSALVGLLGELTDHYDAEEEPYASLRELVGWYIGDWERGRAAPAGEARNGAAPEGATPAEALAYFMRAGGLTQKDLAREGVADQGHLSKVLAGKRAIGRELAKRLGERFKVSPAVFL